MAQSKYKRHSRGGRFRQQGDGLRASVDEIRRQRQIEIDSLKTQALQQKERDSLQISGLRNVAKNESENRNVLQDLENKIYQNKRNAITVRADREVDAILGQAKEFGKESEFWQDFATKHSENYGKMASGLIDYAQYRAAINAYESMSDDQKSAAINSYEGMYDVVENEVGEAVFQIKSLKDRKDLITSTVGRFANNRHLHKMLANDYIQTNEATQSLLRSAKTKDGKPLYNKDTAAALTMNKAYNFIHSNGIPLNSAAAQKIIASARQTAVVETTSLAKADAWKNDELDIQEHVRMVKDSFAEIDRAATKPILQKDPKGKTIPTKGGETVKAAWISGRKSGKEEFNDSIYLLYHVLEGSHVKGDNNSVLPPGHPLRQAETPKQKWQRVIELLSERLDFKTEADAIDALNIPVRDMNTGKIVLNKNGQPSEYLLDKHSEIKTEVIRIIKQKKINSISERDKKIRKDQLKGFTEITSQLETDFNNNDFANTLRNKDWVLSASTWALDPKNKTSEESNYILDILGQSPELFSKSGSFTDNTTLSKKIARVDNEFLSGDVKGALFSYTQLGIEVPRLSNMHEALIAANKLTTFSKKVKDSITNSFKSNLGSGIMETQVSNKDDLEEMVEKGIGRFMVVWASKSDIKDPSARFELTEDVLKKEISDGITKKIGWAAASETLQVGDLTSGWKFAALSNKDLPDDTELTASQVGKLFEGWDKRYTSLTDIQRTKVLASAGITAGDQDSINKQKVNDVLVTHFDKLVTVDDAYRILNAISTGEASNKLLPKNLTKFIGVIKHYKYNLTTREVMNMAIEHIKVNGDSIWTKDKTIDSQFKDYNYEWPANEEDLVKKSCKVTPTNRADGYGVKCWQYLKNQGIDMNQSIINEYLKNRGRFN